MGLALEVGILADLNEHDAEGAGWFRKTFNSLNRFLAAENLPAHNEPDECQVWSADMFGYSGLHYLRRIAAYVDSSGELPPPDDDSSSKDPRLEAYFEHVTGQSAGFLSRLFRKPVAFQRGFDHLICHSDAEGFYLPRAFDEVLYPPDEYEIPGGMVGSSPRLLAELERLVALLEIPRHLTPESDELWEAAESQGNGDATWQTYGIESYSCVVLAEGCRRSIKTGAALVFT